MPRKSLMRHVKNIVVKIGTSSITERGKLSAKKIAGFAQDVVTLHNRGYRITIVSSGAIAAGAAKLGREKKNLTIPEKQAFAALGQTLLMNEYGKQFAKLGIKVGQILLTEDDVKHRGRFLNARHTLTALHDMGIIPIVNENDSVVVKEIKFGDNDTLSAHVASIINADLLILLSDIDGFYRDLDDPRPIEHIREITEEVVRRAGGTGTEYGTGGMATKIYAGRMMIQSGEMMIIARGSEKNVLVRIIEGEMIGTIFTGGQKQLSGKKKWIALMKMKGTVKVDDGASDALVLRKKSLLATGVIGSEGHFDMGDIIDIADRKGRIIGKGVINYNYQELNKIMGKKTDEIKAILGDTFFNEVINRDDMIIF